MIPKARLSYLMPLRAIGSSICGRARSALRQSCATSGSGKTLETNINAEREAMKQYYGDPLWTDTSRGHDLVFDRVAVRGGLDASIRWTEK